MTNQYESEYTVVKSKEKKRRCKNAGIINSCSGKMVHDQMDVRSTGGAGKIKGINVGLFQIWKSPFHYNEETYNEETY